MTDSPTPIPALEVRGLVKRFAGIAAVDGIDLSVKPGERRAIIGPNGAGKSTLFNLVTGSLPCDAGSVRLFGEDVTRASVAGRANRGLGRTYQISNLLLELTVEESLLLAVNRRKVPGVLRPWRALRDLRAEAAEAARRVDLEHRFAEQVRTLAHGEQRQLELGLALASNPRLIMLDEPVGGLGPGERARIAELIRGLDPDTTLILIEHDMDIALGLTERVAVLHQGKVIAQGTPDEVREDSQVREVYMGGNGERE